MREILEAGLSLVNSGYAEKLKDGCLDSLILNVLQPQTHQLYKDLLAYKGICDEQSGSVHIIDDPTREKLFRQLIESGKTSRISESARNYKQPEIGKMFRLSADYSDTINLCNGEPDFDTPMHIVDAAYNALCNGRNKYAPDPGIPSFREAVAEKYSTQFGYSFGFNPLTYDENLDYSFDNVAVLKKISSKIEYDLLLGINSTLILVNKTSASGH